ncbi:MAG TPA: hypothetical protein PK777_16990, partial [Thermoguttaceae bacterium]|nr:hypothetical protein [Thermoguttaceae bacterium]
LAQRTGYYDPHEISPLWKIRPIALSHHLLENHTISKMGLQDHRETVGRPTLAFTDEARPSDLRSRFFVPPYSL